MSTTTQPGPYRRLRIAAGIALAVTFILALVGAYSDGPLAGFSGFPFLSVLLLSVALVAFTLRARRRGE